MTLHYGCGHSPVINRCAQKNSATTYLVWQDFDADLDMSTSSSLDMKNLYVEAMQMLSICNIKDDQDAFGDNLILDLTDYGVGFFFSENLHPSLPS